MSNRVPFHRLLNKLTTHISAAPNTQQRITKSPHMRCFNFPGQRRGEGWRKIQGIHVAMWNCTRFAPTFDADRKGQQKTVRRQVVFNGAIVFKGLHFGPIPTRLLGLGLCFFFGCEVLQPQTGGDWKNQKFWTRRPALLLQQMAISLLLCTLVKHLCFRVVLSLGRRPAARSNQGEKRPWKRK